MIQTVASYPVPNAPENLGEKAHQTTAHSLKRRNDNLPGGHGLGNKALEGKLLLLEVVSSGVLNLKLAHGLAEALLNLVLLAALELEGQSWVRDDLLNTVDVRLKLLLGLEALAESLIVGLELLSIYRDC